MSAHLVARGLTFAHGPHTVLDGIDITLAPRERVGVLGPNGAGKTTLLRLLAGEIAPGRGHVEIHPASARVVLVPQQLRPIGGETAAELVARRTGVAALDRELASSTGALTSGEAGAEDRYSVALDRWLGAGGADLQDRLGAVFAEVGLAGDRRHQPVATMSGGERSRVGLAAILAIRADVVLLDEPTNDLDLDGLDLLEQWVAATRSTIALVSHDRAFLRRVVTAVVEIDDHHPDATRYNGGWDAYVRDRSVRQRRRLQERARTERSWSARGLRRERRPPDNDRAARGTRIERSEQLAARARRTERAIERLDEVDKPWEAWTLHLSVAAAARSGDRVLTARGLVVDRGSFTLGPVDLSIRAGDRLQVAGANGSGKSTLLAALLGDIPADRGSVETGPSVRVGRLDQSRESLMAAATVLDAVIGVAGGSPNEARSTLAKLGLGAEEVRRPAAALSPGERTRAVLAVFMLRRVNTLVLDEPTNHLDLPAIEQLAIAVEEFGGTVVLVSHDRAFVDEVRLTRRIEIADGRVVADLPLG